MTTIAYRDGVLAADTLVTTGRSRAGCATKIWNTDDGALWGVCGKMAYVEACKAWSFGDHAEAAPRIEETTFIQITPDGRVREWWGDGWCESVAQFFAWGSGDDFAIGAMAMGASPARAVEVASLFDTSTGGEVSALSLA